MKSTQKNKLESKARNLRGQILRMIYKAKASHIASAFSSLDIILYLYLHILKLNPKKPNLPSRDRFILSKGWAASALYSILADKGFFPKKLLDKYCDNGTKLVGIATLNGLPGIEATTGSMGHGLPIGTGMAFAGKGKKNKFRVFVMISDGELDEGSTWEAILFAGHHQLDNLTVIIDYNKLQSFGWVKDILNTEPIEAKFKAFNWGTRNLDGHNFEDMEKNFSVLPIEKGKPSLIIANTTKGKGVSFMENNNEWHYKHPNKDEFEKAIKELS